MTTGPVKNVASLLGLVLVFRVHVTGTMMSLTELKRRESVIVRVWGMWGCKTQLVVTVKILPRASESAVQLAASPFREHAGVAAPCQIGVLAVIVICPLAGIADCGQVVIVSLPGDVLLLSLCTMKSGIPALSKIGYVLGPPLAMALPSGILVVTERLATAAAGFGAMNSETIPRVRMLPSPLVQRVAVFRVSIATLPVESDARVGCGWPDIMSTSITTLVPNLVP